MAKKSEAGLIIIPARDEAASVQTVVSEIRDEFPEFDVLVVDDGSSDATGEYAQYAGANVARLPYSLGVGGAMRLGYKYARYHDYQIAVQMDADGQHDPRYLPKLIDRLVEADVVVGARFGGEGEYHVCGPRRWAMTLLSTVLSWLARQRLTDATSGFRACNRVMIESFAGWYPVEYLGDTVETLVWAASSGYQIRQVPVAMRPRQGGMATSPAEAAVYFGRAMVVLLLALIRR